MGNRDFDTQVVCHDQRFAKLSDEFIVLRMSHMRGVNINLFQFDYNENWMGFFLDADGRIYARYGSVDPETRESRNSVDGLLHSMKAVLTIHGAEKAKGTMPPVKPLPVYRPEEIPAMPAQAKNGCIECHMVQTAMNSQHLKEGKSPREAFWAYPPPDNIGIKLDSKRGNVIR